VGRGGAPGRVAREGRWAARQLAACCAKHGWRARRCCRAPGSGASMQRARPPLASWRSAACPRPRRAPST
jgi:hypothetical protein